MIPAALVIDAGTVSRRHARIKTVSGTAMVEDLESTNGTHVNGDSDFRAENGSILGDELSLCSQVLQAQEA